MPETILEFFKSLGLPLEHFEENENTRELWQHDSLTVRPDGAGFTGWVVQLFMGRNGRGELSTFGEITFEEDQGLDLTFPIIDWEDPNPKYPQYSPLTYVREYVSQFRSTT